jgi:FAD/FMN-containing dehydrogenase
MSRHLVKLFLQYISRLIPFLNLIQGGISVAGAIGTGAHGSSLRHPNSLSDQIIRLTIVDGTGEIRVIDDPQEVNAFRVHLGLLGVIIDVRNLYEFFGCSIV